MNVSLDLATALAAIVGGLLLIVYGISLEKRDKSKKSRYKHIKIVPKRSVF